MAPSILACLSQWIVIIYICTLGNFPRSGRAGNWFQQQSEWARLVSQATCQRWRPTQSTLKKRNSWREVSKRSEIYCAGESATRVKQEPKGGVHIHQQPIPDKQASHSELSTHSQPCWGSTYSFDAGKCSASELSPSPVYFKTTF